MSTKKTITTIQQKSYKNCEVFKYKNTRVRVATLEDDYVIELKLLTNDLEPRALHKVVKDKIVVTGIRITTQAAISLMIGLQEQLKKDGFLNI
jgi:hypothetical protein